VTQRERSSRSEGSQGIVEVLLEVRVEHGTRGSTEGSCPVSSRLGGGFEDAAEVLRRALVTLEGISGDRGEHG
jgi:hypothetical protein